MASKPSILKKAKSRPSSDKLGVAGLSGDLSAIREAKQEWSSRLLGTATPRAARTLRSALSPDPRLNVVGVGVGEKVVNGGRTGFLALKFFVRAKYHETHIAADHMLPKSVDGLIVDVDEVGLFRLFNGPNPQTRIRPAQPGCSIGYAAQMAGTFGALVKDADGVYILSNNHILADENQLPPDSPIFQPGLLDLDDQNNDKIAGLTRFEPIDPDGTNQVDCAIAKVADPGNVSNAILQIGPPQGTTHAQHDMVVHKFGRSTRYTAGQVYSAETDAQVQTDAGDIINLSSQILLVGLDGQPFAGPGDSGSLILERKTNLAIGLLVGGSTSSPYYVANHIGDVLGKLKVTLA